MSARREQRLASRVACRSGSVASISVISEFTEMLSQKKRPYEPTPMVLSNLSRACKNFTSIEAGSLATCIYQAVVVSKNR